LITEPPDPSSENVFKKPLIPEVFSMSKEKVT